MKADKAAVASNRVQTGAKADQPAATETRKAATVNDTVEKAAVEADKVETTTDQVVTASDKGKMATTELFVKSVDTALMVDDPPTMAEDSFRMGGRTVENEAGTISFALERAEVMIDKKTNASFSKTAAESG